MKDSVDAFVKTGIENDVGGGLAIEWLVLTHHLPPEPAYFRVKVRRRLERIGAVPLKNSVYVLPSTEDAREDFQWLLHEITREGGEATLCEARFIDSTTDDVLVRRHRNARSLDYEELLRSAESLVAEVASVSKEQAARAPLRARAVKITGRLEQICRMDHFEAPGRDAMEEGLQRLQESLAEDRAGQLSGHEVRQRPRGRTWVTREGVQVDRMASAWLIHRFIDVEASFRFVRPVGYRPEEGELRFDMFEGEYTHVGNACTFETLLKEFDLQEDLGLVALAQIVHDIDLKEDLYGRPETQGVAALLSGIARVHAADMVRLQRSRAVLDDLHADLKSMEPT